MLTTFTRKTLQNKLAEPTLRPQSLDAYLELKHTVEILTQQVRDLEQQKRDWLRKEKKLEEENMIMRIMGGGNQEAMKTQPEFVPYTD